MDPRYDIGKKLSVTLKKTLSSSHKQQQDDFLSKTCTYEGWSESTSQSIHPKTNLKTETGKRTILHAIVPMWWPAVWQKILRFSSWVFQ